MLSFCKFILLCAIVLTSRLSYAKYYLLDSVYFKPNNTWVLYYFNEQDKRIISKKIITDGLDYKASQNIHFPRYVNSLNFNFQRKKDSGIREVSTYNSSRITTMKDVHRFFDSKKLTLNLDQVFYFLNFNPFQLLYQQKDLALYYDKNEHRLVFVKMKRGTVPDKRIGLFTNKYKLIKSFSFFSSKDLNSKYYTYRSLVKNLKKYRIRNYNKNIIQKIKKNLDNNSKKLLFVRNKIFKQSRYEVYLDYNRNLIFLDRYKYPQNRFLKRFVYSMNDIEDIKHFKSFVKRNALLSNAKIEKILNLQVKEYALSRDGIFKKVIFENYNYEMKEVLKIEKVAGQFSRSAVLNKKKQRISLFYFFNGKHKLDLFFSKSKLVKISSKSKINIYKQKYRDQNVFFLYNKTKILYIIYLVPTSNMQDEIIIALPLANQKFDKKLIKSKKYVIKLGIKIVYPIKIINHRVKNVFNHYVSGYLISNSLYPVFSSQKKGSRILKFIFSKLGRKNQKSIIKSQIKAGANTVLTDSSNGLDEIISKEDINVLVDQVVNKIQTRTNDFSNIKDLKHLETIGYKESYKAFVSFVISKMIEKELPELSLKENQKIVSYSMKDFLKCLNVAERSSNPETAESCMNVFIRIAIVPIGEALLSYELKLKQISDKDLLQISKRIYTGCIQKYDLNLYSSLHSEQSLILKSCLYYSIVESIDDIALNEILKSIDEIKREKKIDIPLNNNEKMAIVDSVNKCFVDKNYMIKKSIFYNINFDKLKSIEIIDFIQDVNICVDKLKKISGRMIIKKVLSEYLKDFKVGRHFIDNIINTSYKPCIKLQQRVFASGDLMPELCQDNIALEAAIKMSLLEIGKELGSVNLNELKKAKECKREELNRLNSLIKKKESDSGLAEKKATKCVKSIVVESIQMKVGKYIQKVVNEDDSLYYINIDDKVKESLAFGISSCFEKKLSIVKSYTNISDYLDSIKNRCVLKVLKQDTFLNGVVSLIISEELKYNKLTNEQIKVIKPRLISEYVKSVQDSSTIDEYQQMGQEFIPKAKVICAKYLVGVNIFEVLSSLDRFKNIKSSARNKQIFNFSKIIIQRLFNEHRFSQKFLKSVSVKEFQKKVNQLKRHAFKEIAIFKVTLEAEDHFEDPTVILDFIDKAKNIIRECQVLNSGIDADLYIQKCTNYLQSKLEKIAKWSWIKDIVQRGKKEVKFTINWWKHVWRKEVE